MIKRLGGSYLHLASFSGTGGARIEPNRIVSYRIELNRFRFVSNRVAFDRVLKIARVAHWNSRAKNAVQKWQLLFRI